MGSPHFSGVSASTVLCRKVRPWHKARTLNAKICIL
ncbi:unnamed protein product [Brassica napus]|uniref:(rape) hypothetical protein n=1 Tax=Brassica napus TaxID=3708 RepID=A0A816P054_BRANA|nr:unnamed protein product [Brassica napus]